MKRLSGFPAQVAVVLCFAAAVAAYPLAVKGSADILLAVVVGALLSTVNALLGYLAIQLSFDKSYSVFLKVVIGGMGLRLAVMLGALALLIGVAGLHAIALTASVLAFYFVFIVLEIMFVQRKFSNKYQGQ